ncbi:DUF4007 family protein [Marinicrinis sediminis]|uniref:DUF4007 family protein n=1 Tax=Marinicrinis sediminis TaxID=1652465 RepID=A0ABW5R7G8_9BACL
MAYARHQSFYIRDKWFSKGLRAVKQDKRFFFDEYAFETVGLGKNMLESLKYWLLAFNVLEERTEDGQRVHALSEIGDILFESDRLLQRNESLSILHYHLVRNGNDLSTVFDWYFNKYRETIVGKRDLFNSFITWVSQNEAKAVSKNSLKRDIDCLIQFYTKVPDVNDPEDVLFCPFSRLSLMKSEHSGERDDTIRKVASKISTIGIPALYYVLLDYDQISEDRLIGVDEIVNAENLWGRIFNLTRNKVVEALNILTTHDKYPIEYIRTNNLDYIRLPMVSSIDYIKGEFFERMTY